MGGRLLLYPQTGIRRPSLQAEIWRKLLIYIDIFISHSPFILDRV